MPSFWELFFSPSLVFQILLTGAPVTSVQPEPVVAQTVAATAAGGSSSATATAGWFCQVQTVGQEVLHTCRVLGYEMPQFIFVASILIFLFFATAVYFLHRQSRLTAMGLAQLARQLRKVHHEPGGQVRDEEELAAVRKLMLGERLVKFPWLHFEQTLLIEPRDQVRNEQTDRPISVFSTTRIEEFLSKQALVDSNIHMNFFSAVPGILTGVGLLMTFVAILDGLSHVSVSNEMDVKGIAGLINGLSGKFFSSIIALSCSVLFVTAEKFILTHPQRAYASLMMLLSTRFRRKTSEELLFELKQEFTRQRSRA